MPTVPLTLAQLAPTTLFARSLISRLENATINASRNSIILKRTVGFFVKAPAMFTARFCRARNRFRAWEIMSADFADGVLRTRRSFGVCTGGDSWDLGLVRDGGGGDFAFATGIEVGVGMGIGSVPLALGVEATVFVGCDFSIP